MIVETRAVPPFQKNGYIVACEATRAAVLIDPGDEVDTLLEVAASQSLTVQYILLTHAHVDHVTGVARARDALKVPVYLHRDDRFLYDAAQQQAAFFGLRCDVLPPIDHYYDVGKSLPFGDYEVSVHHTPGHCPGGVCLAIGRKGSAKEDLFVGDTLFAGSIGRTDLPGGDHATLLRSIKEVLFAFGDAARVYSGHGPQTTIGHERRTNPFLQ
ncbi:MAG TPA: MBL fold metallo-hydrolase [Vicinamibacterales bacterium]|nr:MBL fold metallo-hydrolase [Vicinamibacterales bacterium]